MQGLRVLSLEDNPLPPVILEAIEEKGALQCVSKGKFLFPFLLCD